MNQVSEIDEFLDRIDASEDTRTKLTTQCVIDGVVLSENGVDFTDLLAIYEVKADAETRLIAHGLSSAEVKKITKGVDRYRTSPTPSHQTHTCKQNSSHCISLPGSPRPCGS